MSKELPYKDLQELTDKRNKFHKDNYRQWAAEEYYYKSNHIYKVGNPFLPEDPYSTLPMIYEDTYLPLIETLEKVLL